MKRCDESGRSMLEVVIVLSLGLLFASGGLYLWRSVVLKNRSHVLMQRLVAMKTARQATISSHANRPLFRSEMGPYGTMLSIQNGVASQNKDFYWINVITSDPAFRSVLIQEGRDRLDPCLVSETSTEVTFYFPKFKSSLVMGEHNSPNKSHEPTRCPDNSVCGEGYHVVGCEEGYYLDDGNCSKCPQNAECTGGTFTCLDGYFKKEKSCVVCGDGVQSCDVEGNPTECQADRWGGDCSLECPSDGVQSCDIGGLICDAGYYEHGLECLPCGDNEYSSAGAKSCTSCDDGYTHNEDHTDCVQVTCNGSNSQTCIYGHQCSYFITRTDSNYKVCKYSVTQSDDRISLSEEKGCDENEYCYLRYTKPDCSSLSKNGKDTTLYGFCIELDQTESVQLCTKDLPKNRISLEPIQPCASGEYCYMRWNQDGELLTGTEEYSHGTCLSISETLDSDL